MKKRRQASSFAQHELFIPQGYDWGNAAQVVIDHAVQISVDPPKGTKLIGIVRTSVSDDFRFINRLCFFKADALLGIYFVPFTFLRIGLKTHIDTSKTM